MIVAERGEKGDRGERGMNGAAGLKGDRGEEHICSQAVTLNTICLTLDNIEKSLAKVENKQDEYLREIQEIRERDARYPSPEEVTVVIKKVESHETLFKITGATLLSAWGLILFLANKLWHVS
jgi:hypothetical protein